MVSACQVPTLLKNAETHIATNNNPTCFLFKLRIHTGRMRSAQPLSARRNSQGGTGEGSSTSPGGRSWPAVPLRQTLCPWRIVCHARQVRSPPNPGSGCAPPTVKTPTSRPYMSVPVCRNRTRRPKQASDVNCSARFPKACPDSGQSRCGPIISSGPHSARHPALSRNPRPESRPP